MIYPKIPLAQSIIQICASRGIKHVVISPGSRNAPLTIGFANNESFICYSIVDERCAAFYALGIAQQTGNPVALICTSGSAVLNYYPAFAEAFYSQIPLIVISADRPINKIDIGDGQTIRQRNVFENHSLYNANLTELASEENDFEINQAITISITKKGPVHINAPFEEPLYETVNVAHYVPNIFAAADKEPELSNEDLFYTSEKWNATKKKLILVGVNPPNAISAKIIKMFSTDPSVVVMTEKTSNLHDPNFLDNIDAIITPFNEADFEAMQPEILITFGGLIVSKRIKSFLRKYKPLQHWHIDPFRAYDTFGALTHHFSTTPNKFFKDLLPKLQFVESDYSEKAQQIKRIREIKHAEFLDKVVFSDFKVFQLVLNFLPKNSMLQISNSAAIRYAQLFEIDKTISVYCNRGTSGIDGSTSTAIGAAVGSNIQTTLITGDIGFLYDSNALWNNYIPKNFKIILVNNGGGGIFRILPGHSENNVFSTFFETQHHLTAEHLAKMYDLNYLVATDEKTLKSNLRFLYSQNEKPSILEVFTPTNINDQVLSNYFKNLS